MTFPNGKLKALTFSYDDGVIQDKRLIEILNKYNLKGTFNINSGKQSSINRGDAICRMNYDDMLDLYKGHELAIHSLTHPHLENLDVDTINNEIKYDKKIIEHIFDVEVVGSAYPFGSYNEMVIEILKQNNIKYARACNSTNSFDIQTDLLQFNPTCHHNAENLMELAKEFVDLKPVESKLFYVWGHSYEFDCDNNWHIIEEFCEYISNHDDIFYGTNREVFCL